MFPIDNLPTWLAHLAFPLGYGTGSIGWCFPGVVLMQDLHHGSSGVQWRPDVGAFEGNWNGPGNNVDYLTADNAGFRPQIQARLHVQDKTWLAYVAAHYREVDLRGVGGTAAAPIKDKVKSVDYEVGGQWKPGAVVLKELVYSGNGLSEILGAMAQFGDIQETRDYVQAGYSFTPHWSANVFYGISKPDNTDVIARPGSGAAGRLENRQSAVSLQYTAGTYDWASDGCTTRSTAPATAWIARAPAAISPS